MLHVLLLSRLPFVGTRIVRALYVTRMQQSALDIAYRADSAPSHLLHAGLLARALRPRGAAHVEQLHARRRLEAMSAALKR